MKKIIFSLLIAVMVFMKALAVDYDSAEWVMKVQQALNDAGYDCGAPDGIAGAKTYAAIERFRSDQGLPAGTAIDEELCSKLGLIEEKAEDTAWESQAEVPEEQWICDVTENFTLRHGELLSATQNGNILIIKAKIESNLTNLIDQNYYNVGDLIKNQSADAYEEIQYWAVADMTDGSESKVISFTLSKYLIVNVKTMEVLENELGDYVEDLWIHPSLRDDASGKKQSNKESLQAVAEILELFMADSYGGNFRAEIDEESDSILCDCWGDGVGIGVLYAQSGDADCIAAFDEMKIGTKAAAKSAYESANEILPGSHVVYSVLNDLDLDRAVLIFYDGECIYDAVND